MKSVYKISDFYVPCLWVVPGQKQIPINLSFHFLQSHELTGVYNFKNDRPPPVHKRGQYQ